MEKDLMRGPMLLLAMSSFEGKGNSRISGSAWAALFGLTTYIFIPFLFLAVVLAPLNEVLELVGAYIKFQVGLALLCGTLEIGLFGFLSSLTNRRWGRAFLSLTVWLPLWGAALLVYVRTIQHGWTWSITLLGQMKSAGASLIASDLGRFLSAVTPVFLVLFIVLVGIPFLVGGKKAVLRWWKFLDRTFGYA